MKILLVVLIAYGCTTDCYSQTSIFSQSISGANARPVSISSFKGQTLMIVILPVKQTDSSIAFLARIDSITLAHKGQLKIIAVPSSDEGFTSDSASSLSKWYQSALDSSIVITQPVHTNRASAVQQNGLFSWLTHASQNIHFDYEITGAGTMFFVNSAGELYGVFGPEAMFSDKVIRLVLE